MDADAALIRDYARDQGRRGLQPTTITQSAFVLHRLSDWLDGRSLLEVTPADIEAFLDYAPPHGRTKRPVTRGWYLSMLHPFYRWVVDSTRLLAVAPTTSIRRPKIPKRYPRPITTADLEIALAIAPPTERVILSLAAFEGMRCIEIARLTREDIFDQKDPPVLIAYGKGSKDRVLPLHSDAWRALRLLPMPKHGHILHRADGSPLTAKRVSRIGNAYLDSVGTDARMHQLRHWFGTETYEKSGHDLLLVQSLLGHEDPATTAIYAGFNHAGAWDAVEALSTRPTSAVSRSPATYGGGSNAEGKGVRHE